MALFIAFLINVSAIGFICYEFSLGFLEPFVLILLFLGAMGIASERSFISKLSLVSLSALFMALIVIKPVKIHNFTNFKASYPRDFYLLHKNLQELQNMKAISGYDAYPKNKVYQNASAGFSIVAFYGDMATYRQYEKSYVPALLSYQQELREYRQVSEDALASLPCDPAYYKIFIPSLEYLKEDVDLYNKKRHEAFVCFLDLERKLGINYPELALEDDISLGTAMFSMDVPTYAY
ncbi:MAG TPA: hypothetical protein DCL21_06230, partial [Alphaproteobacteria bacterium]|nr:hypothetical protein [Alphaproteobacteria bacterium]